MCSRKVVDIDITPHHQERWILALFFGEIRESLLLYSYNIVYIVLISVKIPFHNIFNADRVFIVYCDCIVRVLACNAYITNWNWALNDLDEDERYCFCLLLCAYDIHKYSKRQVWVGQSQSARQRGFWWWAIELRKSKFTHIFTLSGKLPFLLPTIFIMLREKTLKILERRKK